ncbi:MAG: hypothetical protein FJY85_06695, partial [Deltaproteobacteria bacterium]|nr:hypothetical protein [Deltaproteobacteria bacterium]
LYATVEPKGVRLEWSPPGRLRGLRSYSIYRGDTDAPQDMQAVGRTKWAETYFVDEKVERDKTYFYSVRSIKMNRGISLESEPSESVKVFVPLVAVSPPENVSVMVVRGGIRVDWDPVNIESREPEYNVYQSEGGGMFEKINREPIASQQFIDRNVKRGKTYRYAVTAFPKGKSDQESSRSGSEAVTYNQ